MSLNYERLGTAIKDAILTLTDEEKFDVEVIWQRICEPIVFEFNNYFQISYNVITVNTSTYTLQIYDNILQVTTDSTITLPSAQAVSGRNVIIKSVNKTVNIVTEGSETIDGMTDITITNYSSVTLYSDGSNWFII